MEFPNIKLQKDLSFNSIEGLIKDTEFKKTGTDCTIDVDSLNKLYTLHKKIADNAYVISYQLMDEYSNDAKVSILFGLSQLLRRNYWSAIYHIDKGLSNSPLNDGCNKISRLVKYLDKIREVDNSSKFDVESPLVTDNINPEDFFKAYKKLEHIDIRNFLDDKSKLLQIVESYYKLSIHINNIIRINLKRHKKKSLQQEILLAKSYLNVLLPGPSIEICERLIAEAEHSDLKDKFLSECYFILAYSYNLIDNDDKAAACLVDLPKSYLISNPSKGIEGYNFTKLSRNKDLGQKYLSETCRTIKEENISKKKYFGEVNCATKSFQIQQTFGRIRKIPPILISTISKSGSTFLPSQLIMKLGIPRTSIFCENTNADTYWYDESLNEEVLGIFSKGGAICRQHFAPTDSVLKILSNYGIRKILFHIRDPRQSLISWLYYKEAQLRRYSNPSAEVRGITPAKFGQLDAERKIDFYIETFYKQTIKLIKDWFRVKQETPYGVEVKITRFEDMITNQDNFFDEIFQFYGINNVLFYNYVFYRITNMLKPKRLTKKRKGEKKGWETLLNDSQIKRVNNLMPEYLRKIYPF